ncbi:hypothetical protein EGT74_07885 [Chitinophaga lutea]|uniref:Uncharacterized protein n=1 Tax=Chitinophaga lutea TaxID=2488634 RepID=A0A3N4PZN8_9BACT|nr:hypothetical protein [Chitinophaga lutea]RPE13428.1 hypothetical protein EGT74_07885 [Chitinophaga lutea]
MLKNWKSLFLKPDENEAKPEPASEAPSFPVGNSTPAFNPASEALTAKVITDPVVSEVLEVYESGLDSINMPGYDFYEFYKAVSTIGVAGEQTYQMAFQMAKTLDKTLTPQKLLLDAEFYISKINEVHNQYVNQGQQKLSALEEQKSSEKTKLTAEVDKASMRITQLRAELQQLEADISHKKTLLSKIDESHYPKEKAVREKLNANDLARKTSIDRLNTIKEGIQRFIK